MCFCRKRKNVLLLQTKLVKLETFVSCNNFQFYFLLFCDENQSATFIEQNSFHLENDAHNCLKQK